MFHGNTYKNCETQQWFICHYNVSQIVSLKKAMDKQTFFCFNAAVGILHKLPYKNCCTTLNVFIWLTVKCSSTTCIECTAALTLQQWLCKNMPQCYVICIQSIYLECLCDWATQVLSSIYHYNIPCNVNQPKNLQPPTFNCLTWFLTDWHNKKNWKKL